MLLFITKDVFHEEKTKILVGVASLIAIISIVTGDKSTKVIIKTE